MIYGIGIDLVHVPDFRAQLDVPGTRFVDGTFTEAEQRACTERPGDTAAKLAARFAAKEAFLKAWSGPRFGEAPHLTSVDPREIEVVSDRWGRPALRLHGTIAECMEALGVHRVHLSLTHDGPSAMASVLLESDARALDY